MDVAVCILAGGRATRLPGKLLLDVSGVPMVVRVYENVAAGREAALAVADASAAPLAGIGARVVVDAWPDAGPLGGLLSACAVLRAPWVFAVAGDAPFVTSAILDALSAARCAGDEAVVPVHGSGRLEPLAALYERARVLVAGRELLESGGRAMHALLDRLHVRTVPFDDGEAFANVNTPAEYERVRARLQAPPG